MAQRSTTRRAPLIRYYDRDGQPMEMLEWAERHGDPKYRRIAFDKLDGGVEVSTIWTGMCYGDEEPLIFETMVLGGKFDQFQMRYAKELEALDGHEATVAMVLAKGGQ